jgi:hypothetical protein
MKFRKLRKRDWIMVLAIGAVVGVASIMDDFRGDGSGSGGEGWGAARGGSEGAPAPRGGGRTEVPEGVTRFGSSVVVDAHGFGQPVEAVSVLVPEGWGFQSRVTWTGEGGFCSGDHAGVFWRVESPDGSRAVASFPGFLVASWPDLFQSKGVAPRGHCHLGVVESPRQLAESVLVPALLPGNRIESVEEVREVPDEVRQAAASRARIEAMVGARTTPGGLLVTTRSPDGRHEEAILVYFLLTDYASAGPLVPTQRMIITTSPTVLRAPAGEVESFLPVAATILATVRYNPGWQRAIEELDQRITEIAVQGTAARSRILAESAREVGEIQMSGWQNRMDAGARGMEAVTSAIAGLSQRIDPHTGRQVGLDASGVRFFANPHGEYLVVQAADVDPRRLFPSENWQEMGSATAPRN